VIGRSECHATLTTNFTLDPWLRSGGSAMMITELGYLFLTLFAVAVVLFCWLGFASISNLRRDK
jgi:hypothetical protein